MSVTNNIEIIQLHSIKILYNIQSINILSSLMEPKEKKVSKLEAMRMKNVETAIKKTTDSKSGWNVGAEYKVHQIIGKGAYSTVASATHIKSGTKVAIKKVVGFINKKHEALRILRQVLLLRLLSHPNIITLYEIIIPDIATFTEIYLVEQFFPSDIKRVMKSNKNFTQKEVESITYQILRALKYLESAKVLHRDLKPENVLINTQSNIIKLCDFGLARPVNYQEENKVQTHVTDNRIKMEIEEEKKNKIDLSGHVATRWYRAPELILLEKHYNSAIDVWSVGCIFAQLLNMMKQNSIYFTERTPLFPGKACYPLSPPKGQVSYKNINDFPHSNYDQLNIIFQVLGTPTDIDFITDQRAINYIKSFGFKQKKPFKTIFKYLNTHQQNFLENTLVFNPNKRLSIRQSLEHPLFDNVRQLQCEVETQALKLQLDNLSIDEMKELFLKQLEYYKQNKPKFYQ